MTRLAFYVRDSQGIDRRHELSLGYQNPSGAPVKSNKATSLQRLKKAETSALNYSLLLSVVGNVELLAQAGRVGLTAFHSRILSSRALLNRMPHVALFRLNRFPRDAGSMTQNSSEFSSFKRKSCFDVQ